MSRTKRITNPAAMQYMVNAFKEGKAVTIITQYLSDNFEELKGLNPSTVTRTFERMSEAFNDVITNDEVLAKQYTEQVLDIIQELRKSTRQAIAIQDELIEERKLAQASGDEKMAHFKLTDLHYTWDRLKEFSKLLLQVENKLVNTTVILDKSRTVEMVYAMLAHLMDEGKVKIMDPGLKMKVEAKRKKKKEAIA